MIALISCSITTSHDSKADFLYLDYNEYFRDNGVELIIVSNAQKGVRGLFDTYGVEGVILSGGNDIGEYPERDKLEFDLLEESLNRNLPVLGICRGMHLINKYFGGSVPVNIKKEIGSEVEHVASCHTLKLEDEMFGFFGKKDICTNSYHNYGIIHSVLSPSLKVQAVSEGDGIIEAVSHCKYPIVGIQWHPERRSPDATVGKTLIDSFKRRKFFWREK